ncbi:protein-disulfide reductase DsbD domain-containing protein [Consotaella salsifontis]|uniref:Thiol-disulfide interchange protein, contains DsbC and DsbD domains n=1 Tax=Consotaella salsifontis TaxID=1365950 RepID=A0A1T4MWV9_9HYPH|nr:protein-disulfide reductase DsbD domain-containing protein [Consotaella salsifontis]SJZ71336.1 Thiol-disulfide interchange protein, contains DsbC and DsbD domains [Consotaella salsifontis]
MRTRIAASALIGAALALSSSLWSLGAANAAGSSTFETDGVALSLVAAPSGTGDAVRAALFIDLEPGWKTYWIDPGEAGIPPQIGLSPETKNLELESIAFPAPTRFEEAGFQSNGYKAPLAVALSLRKTKPDSGSNLALSVMLGICHDICVPVSAELSLDPAGETDKAAVDTAFADLPRRDSAAEAITEASIRADGSKLSLKVAASAAGDSSDLFVTAPGGWYFGPPEDTARTGGEVVFTLPVLDKPKEGLSSLLNVDAILVTGEDAIEARDLAVVREPK